MSGIEPMQAMFELLREQAARDVSDPADERDQLGRTLKAMFDTVIATGNPEDKATVLMLRDQILRVADIDNGRVPDMFRTTPTAGRTRDHGLYAAESRRRNISIAVDYVMRRDKCSDVAASKRLAGAIKMKHEEIRSAWNAVTYKTSKTDLGLYTINLETELDKLVELINSEI